MQQRQRLIPKKIKADARKSSATISRIEQRIFATIKTLEIALKCKVIIQDIPAAARLAGRIIRAKSTKIIKFKAKGLFCGYIFF